MKIVSLVTLVSSLLILVSVIYYGPVVEARLMDKALMHAQQVISACR
ncbi:MAG: hypothetical protein ACJZ9G_05275 [Rhodospirillales bacterium]